MTTLATTLKNEITRLSRKEIRTQTASTKKASAAHRREIAELKRLVQDLSKRVAFLEGQERKRVSRPAATIEAKEPANGFRFSPGWVKAHRQKLGFSAADYARLVGVSALTIYNWEHGRTRPREQQLAALATVRALGKREAQRRLELLAG
ncbi:MAG: helix-turn-helix domain-containing protein [Planctomycetota bacterium]|jgi:DNA-binding transcriptional regulator YiaG